MMVGYLRAIKLHQEFVAIHPELKDFRWSKSDPPGTPRHDLNEYPKMMQMPREHHRKLKQQRKRY